MICAVALALAVQLSSRYDWYPVHRSATRRLIAHYFNAEADPSHECKVFCVEGVPAASILYKRVNGDGDPVVDEFHPNRGMMLLCDCWGACRETLYREHRNVDFSNATNRLSFLMEGTPGYALVRS